MNSLPAKKDSGGHNQTMEHSTMAGTIDQHTHDQVKMTLENEKKLLEDENEELKMKLEQVLSHGNILL